MIAIIPAAGKGTRFAPVTKVIPKEMLPFGAKPAIQVIAEEAIAAGAREIAIVISPEKELVRRYFEQVDLGVPVRFEYQPEQKGLGHAVLCAGRPDELALVLLGDAVVTGANPSAEMAAVSAAHGGAGVIGLKRVPRERISRYGVAALAADGRIVDLVEKPSLEEAPSDVAISGRYLLDPAVFDYLENQAPGKGGEIQLTDAIRRMLADHPVYGCVYAGARQDIGDPEGYFKALEAYYGRG